MIQKEYFGETPEGRIISLYTIENGRLSAAVTDLGAVLVRLLVPDRQGRAGDILLGFDRGEAYLNNPHCIGGTLVPVANRTKNGSVRIGGKEYRLPANEGANNLHSDRKSFVTMWETAGISDHSVTFVLERRDMEDGLPGNRRFETTYTLEADGLRIDFAITSSCPTYLNPVNHAYFNLAGRGYVGDQVLKLYASAFTPLDEEQIPTGEIRPVLGTPFDFCREKPIGQDIKSRDPQLLLAEGYDHNFVIDGYTGDGRLMPVAQVRDPGTGRRMEVLSTQPGVQFYTANFTDVEGGKGGVHYRPREAFCLETQFFPDSLHHENFPQALFGGDTGLHASTLLRFPPAK